MAENYPPDGDRKAGTKRGGKSGKVADFRYKRSSQPKAKGPAGTGEPPGSPPRARQQPGNRHQAGAAHPADSARMRPGETGREQAVARATSPNQRSVRPGPRQAYAALDLGTNNCRLLIARPSGRDFTVIDAFSRVVKLGEGLARSGRLSDAAMDRTLGALAVCAEKLQRRNVYLARSVATEACRRAANGPEFIERVRRETGIALDIISAQEEARLAVLGCHILLEQGEGPAVIFDIGGGSTELVLLEPGGGPVPRILDWQSVPWGVVSLTDTVGHGEADAQVRAERYRQMRQLVYDSFETFAGRIERHAGMRDLRLLGTSGTVTTLASLHLELPQYDRKAVDGLIVPAAAMREISASLAGMSPQERSTLPCIGRDRAELVVAGCAILETILDIWPASRLGVADRGIREGILRSLMAADLQRPEAAAAR